MAQGTEPVQWIEHNRGWKKVDDMVIEEARLTIYVNGTELVSLMATPLGEKQLAIGFLRNERLISGLDEIEEISTREEGCCVDVWLNRSFSKPEHQILTSGCGGGITFTDEDLDLQIPDDPLRIDPEQLHMGFRNMQKSGSLYAQAGGIHGAALFDGKNVLAFVEDIGRHNSIDKLLGECILKGISTSGRALLATGRVSSEMLIKAARMGCPIMASRSSPTSLSIKMARAWDMTLVGYVRGGRMRVYSSPERVGAAPDLMDSGESS